MYKLASNNPAVVKWKNRNAFTKGNVSSSEHQISVPRLAQRVESSLVGWRVSRLRTSLAGPLAIVTAGTLKACATLWARAHEADGHPAWTITPYEFIERGIPEGTHLLFLSRSGRHHDLLAAARHAISRGLTAHAVVSDGRSPLVSMLRDSAPENGVLVLECPEEFTGVPGIRAVPFAVLAAAMYGNGGPYAHLFNSGVFTLPNSPISHLVCLGVGHARPAAVDLALRCRKTRIAPATVSDVRELSHGAAYPLDPATSWFIFFYSGERAEYVHRYAELLPVETPRTFIATTMSGVEGGVHLMAQGARLHQSMIEPGAIESVGVSDAHWSLPLFYLSLDSQ